MSPQFDERPRMESSALCTTCLYEAPLFQGLANNELDYLSQFTSERISKKGEMVVHEGDAITHLSFLKKGLLKLYTGSNDGKGQIISLAKPNDCVGLLSVFSTPNYHYSMNAIEDSWLCHVMMEPVKEVLRRNGDFGITILARVSKAADFIIQHNLELSRLHLRGRIAYILLDFSENIYNSLSFELPVSRKEIGELIGMTTENVIRILSEFRRDELITISNKTITIWNVEMLRRISKSG